MSLTFPLMKYRLDSEFDLSLMKYRLDSEFDLSPDEIQAGQ